MLPDTQNDFAVYGSDGRITGKETIWEARLDGPKWSALPRTGAETYEYDYLANFVDELEDVEKAVEEGPGAPGHRPGTDSRPPRSRSGHRVRPHRPRSECRTTGPVNAIAP